MTLFRVDQLENLLKHSVIFVGFSLTLVERTLALFCSPLISSGRIGHSFSGFHKQSGPVSHLCSELKSSVSIPREASSAGLSLLVTHFHCRELVSSDMV